MRIHRKDTRSGMNPRQRNSRQRKCPAALSKAETTGAGFTTAPTSVELQVSMNLEFKPLRFAGTQSQRRSWSGQKVSQLNLAPSEQVRVRRGESRRLESGPGLSARKYCVAARKAMASFGRRARESSYSW
jgi:hypothetical protein